MPYENTVRALHERLSDAMRLHPEVADYAVALGQIDEFSLSVPWSGKTFRHDGEREFELEAPG